MQFFFYSPLAFLCAAVKDVWRNLVSYYWQYKDRVVRCDQSVNLPILNFDDLTQEHIKVKRVDLVYFVCFHCQHV